MNPLLKLRGEFSHSKASGIPGAPELSPKQRVTSDTLKKLRDELYSIANNWDEINDNPVISVYYDRTIPKSRRPKRLFSWDKKPSDSYIVGAKFWGPNSLNHQFVYCVSKENIYKYINELEICAHILSRHFNDQMNRETMKTINSAKKCKTYSKLLEAEGIKRTPFCQLLVDSASILRFGVDRDPGRINDSAFVTLYKTDITANNVLELLGLSRKHNKAYGEHTLMLDREGYATLIEKAPYLIAMSFEETLEFDDMLETNEIDNNLLAAKTPFIPSPSNEATIGVIDTLFFRDKASVYFANWVTFEDLSSDAEPIDENSYLHGTEIDSIIVDGPALNPGLEDGCGRFRVKHYGITRSKKLHLFRLVQQIERIISLQENREIKVWNISLGDEAPIHAFSISPLAALLDEIQAKYDVIFVVAGTNKNKSIPLNEELSIGSPADSINSIVVNSVKSTEEPASYTRTGPVLNFFTKPDVAYYGGDSGDPMAVWGPKGLDYRKGTSFAAPWIARKLAYLINNKGFSREAAKALLIDSASGWNPKNDLNATRAKGHGVVPIHINDILGSNDDEIKFVITGKTELYQTYNYRLPVPLSQGKFPYNARATLCYFPHCSISQGVDYTDTELDFRFGRLKDGKITPINNDLQNDLRVQVEENDARKNFRKWDNVKIISETIKTRKIAKKMYGTPLWGIDITSKKRLDNKERESVRFGIVVTLKEMNGKNRLDTFIRACQANKWFIEKIEPEQDADFLASLEDDVDFEE